MSISEDSIKYKMPNSWGYYSQALIALRMSLWADYYSLSDYYNHVLKMWIEGIIKNFDSNPFPQELDPFSGAASQASSDYSSSILLFIYAVRRLKLLWLVIILSLKFFIYNSKMVLNISEVKYDIWKEEIIRFDN